MSTTKWILVAATAAACGANAPAKPDWQADVLPVLAANCVKCHGYPAQFGAPAGFRLDVYDDAAGVDEHGLVIHGAATMYYRIAARVDDGTMPPALPLTGDAQAILDHWAAQGVDGTPQPITSGGTYTTPPPPIAMRAPGNSAPKIVVTPSTKITGGVHYVITDADHDLVEGRLLIGGLVIADHLRAGQGDVALDLLQVPDGAHSVDASLDDGVATTQTGVYAVTVTGNGATPLAITINYPQPVDFVAQADTAQVDVCANQAATADVIAVAQDGKTMTLASGYALPACVVGPSATTVAWQSFKDALPDGVSSWRIRVVPAGDAAHAVTSPVFRIQHGAASGHFADVQPIFATACGTCHATCGSDATATLFYDFNDYTDSPDRTGTNPCGFFKGVGSTKGLIYDHAIVRKDMPPGDPTSSTPALSDDDRQKIAAWFLGGANP